MRDEKKIAELRKKAMQLPLTPGVYIMKDAMGKIIYIGKAKALKNRVSQYFTKVSHHPVKVEKMVENVDHFEYVLVDSEFEALILEASLIKQNMPKYNILLKDDKGYCYIRYTSNEEYPRITTVLQKDHNDDATYLGPYYSSFTVREAVDEANRVFKLATCTRMLSKDSGKERPCLNYHIGLCMAPCSKRVSKEEYQDAAQGAFNLLKNGGSEAKHELEKKMNESAEALEFEKAAKYRDVIIALSKLSEKQKVVSCVAEDEDIIAFAQADGILCIQVLSVRTHRLCDREEYVFDAVDAEQFPSFREEFLVSYYSMKQYIPHAVLIDGDLVDAPLIEQFLSDKAKHKVLIRFPQKGEGKALMNMASNNATIKLRNLSERGDRKEKTLEELRDLLGLDKIPSVIESYDISHTAGNLSVAAMVVFKNGVVDKSAMRRFKIKTVTGIDDPASLAEVVMRSLSRRIQGDKKFGMLPDLILLDGGKSQVSVVSNALQTLGVNVPLFGMVKDDKHRTRAVTTDGSEISISSARSVFALLSEIQDEVHRCAIGYHRSCRGKASIYMSLTDIPGIGNARATAILRKFRTIKAIREATVEELAVIKGMNMASAQAVKSALSED